MTRSNIVLILTDQLRTDALGCYGGTHVPTPHLDALARRSTVYDRCYVNNPICTPSRASLWTGKSIFGHGVHTIHDVLPASERLFPDRLRELGYSTALFGKLHVSGRLVDANELPLHAGFDVCESALSPYNHNCRLHAYRDWLRQRDPDFLARLAAEGSEIGPIPDAVHFSTWVAERSADFIARHDPEKPFFCCASFVDPHDPYDDHPPECLAAVNLRGFDAIDRHPAPADLPSAVRREEAAAALGSVDDYTAGEILRMRRGYHASVGFLDTCVGRIMRALERAGTATDTWVIFTTDHGDMLGQRRLLGKGAHFYEPCARVPLLVRTPGGNQVGARSASLVQLHDLAATVLTAAGDERATLQALMPDSRPLQDGGGHACVFAAYRNSCINRQKLFWDPPVHCTMARNATHKLTLYHGADGVAPTGEGELYDLSIDPGETRNLWSDPTCAGIRRELSALIADWIAREMQASGGRRGTLAFPAAKSWLKNYPIKLNGSRLEAGVLR